jgi:hypothetical protein
MVVREPSALAAAIRASISLNWAEGGVVAAVLLQAERSMAAISTGERKENSLEIRI